jgi:hypothetical protein
MEPEHSQEPSTGRYSKPDQSSITQLNLSLQDPS